MVTKPTHFEPTGIAWDRMQSYVFKLSACKTCLILGNRSLCPANEQLKQLKKTLKKKILKFCHWALTPTNWASRIQWRGSWEHYYFLFLFCAHEYCDMNSNPGTTPAAVISSQAHSPLPQARKVNEHRAWTLTRVRSNIIRMLEVFSGN